MAYEPVLMVWNYYDGPRSGIALFGGAPHVFTAEDNGAGDSDVFSLSQVDEATLAVATEQWSIWKNWESAFHRGEVAEETHPGRGTNARYADLQAMLDSSVARLPVAQWARGQFRPCAKQAPQPKGVLVELEVEWTRCQK